MKKSPCTKTCPERSSDCHTWCEKYIEFREECDRKRDKRNLDLLGTPNIDRIVKRAMKARSRK